MKEIFLLGVGHATPIFIELSEACGYTVKGLYHYNNERTGETDHGVPILGSFDDLYQQDLTGMLFCLTMGNMEIKEEVSKRLLAQGATLPSLIHPSANVSRFARVSPCGVLIDRGCEVQPDVIIEEGCVLWSGVTVCHNTELAPYTFCGPCSLVGAFVQVGARTFIGQRALLISGKVPTVGTDAIIGAGAVVTKAVGERTVVIGNPAKGLTKVKSGGGVSLRVFFRSAAPRAERRVA